MLVRNLLMLSLAILQVGGILLQPSKYSDRVAYYVVNSFRALKQDPDYSSILMFVSALAEMAFLCSTMAIGRSNQRIQSSILHVQWFLIQNMLITEAVGFLEAVNSLVLLLYTSILELFMSFVEMAWVLLRSN